MAPPEVREPEAHSEPQPAGDRAGYSSRRAQSAVRGSRIATQVSPFCEVIRAIFMLRGCSEPQPEVNRAIFILRLPRRMGERTRSSRSSCPLGWGSRQQRRLSTPRPTCRRRSSGPRSMTTGRAGQGRTRRTTTPSARTRSVCRRRRCRRRLLAVGSRCDGGRGAGHGSPAGGAAASGCAQRQRAGQLRAGAADIQAGDAHVRAGGRAIISGLQLHPASCETPGLAYSCCATVR